ncbi:MAG: fatty acid desaturase [Verrucomicrobiales bacterium]|nr:fatty acid desaturase [Verrucomicrobiales bacterium]
MKSRFPFSRVNWLTSLFLLFTLLGALIGTPMYIYHYGLDWFQVAMFMFYVPATAMGITLGYHRLFAHKAFKAKWPVKLATLIFGACAFENSVLDWASDHRKHHKHVDHEDDDPYSIKRGFFWAHVGWLIFKLTPGPLENVPDLKKDKLVMWQHRYCQRIAFFVGLVLPAVLGYFWNGGVGALGGFLIAGLTRVVVVQHSTFFINSLCHTIGRRPYSKASSARDSPLMAVLTFGEGYHNYHHSFQHDYRNGVKRRSWDPTKWAIWLMSKVGLTSDLRRVPAEKILLAELAETRREVAEKEEALLAAKPFATDCPKWQSALDSYHALLENFTESYHELEASLGDSVTVSRKRLKEWRAEAQQLLDQLAMMSRMEVASPA